MTRNALMEAFRRVEKHGVHRFFRPLLTPNLETISRTVQGTWHDPRDFVAFLVGGTEVNFAQLAQEFDLVEARLQTERKIGALRYPAEWRMENESALAVYSLVRAFRPEVVVETGVANGESTSVILSALAKNGRGSLTSIDVSRDVGSLIPTELKRLWNLVILTEPHDRSLRKALADLGRLDVFLHDSCHEYRWQTLEFESAYEKMGQEGYLLSDDIDWSYAFIDFVERRHVRAAALIGTRKVFGGIEIDRTPS